MIYYRWATAAIIGKWRETREKAMRDALGAGQAELIGGGIALFEFARIEEGEVVGKEMLVRK